VVLRREGGASDAAPPGTPPCEQRTEGHRKERSDAPRCRSERPQKASSRYSTSSVARWTYRRLAPCGFGQYALPVWRVRKDRIWDHRALEVRTVSAHEELQRNGQFGADCLQFLTRLMRREAQRMWVLRPAGGWSDSAVDDLVQDFFVRKGRAVTQTLYAEARDDEQFGRILCSWVQNWLIDRARVATDDGALRFRLEKLLPARDEFVLVPAGRPGAGRWALAGDPDGVFAGDVEDLARAGRAVPVKAVSWKSETRRAPLTDTPSLVRLLEQIFGAAGGSLELGQIVYAVHGRFHGQIAPDVTFGDVPESSARLALALRARETADRDLEAEEAEIHIGLMARRLRGLLSDGDLRVLDVLDDPEQIAARLGVGRSQAYLRRKKVTAVLADLIGDDPDRDLIFAEARNLAAEST